MSPILVNVPGGSMDSAGQGVAAAQQYRAGEQQMRQRDEAFEFEKATTLRKVQFEEDALAFDREQLASQQEAEADALLGMAIESGQDVGDQGAYRDMLMRTSPRFRSQMATELGRATRLKAQQAEIDEIAGELELTPETQAKVQNGELVEPGAIRRSMAVERGKIARTADQESARLLALESWQKRQAEPNFDMPDEAMDPEAHGDVMEILGELSEGAATNPKTNYRALHDQLTLLTTKGMRAAAMAILQRDIGGVDPRGLPRSSRMGAMQQPDFAGKAEGEYVDRRGDAAQADRRATDAAPSGPKPSAAQRAKADEATGPIGGPSARLGEPVPEKLAGVETVGELEATVKDALEIMGFTSAPKPGTPEYRIYLRVIDQATKRAAEVKAQKTEEHKQKIETQASKPTRGSMQ